VTAALGAFLLRCADDPVDDARLRAVPGDALAPDVHRDDVHELQHRAGFRQPHPVELRRIVAGEVEVAVRAPGAAGVAHVLKAVEDRLGQRPRLHRLEVLREFHHHGVRLVAVRRLAGSEQAVVVREGHPPVTVVPVRPRERAPLDAETVGANVLHRLGVEDLDRAHHRPLWVIGVGGVELAVHDHRAVEVQDGALLVALPLLHKLAGLLVVLADHVVVHGVEVARVHAHALVRLRDRELPDLIERRRRAGFGCEAECEERYQQVCRCIAHDLSPRCRAGGTLDEGRFRVWFNR